LFSRNVDRHESRRKLREAGEPLSMPRSTLGCKLKKYEMFRREARTKERASGSRTAGSSRPRPICPDQRNRFAELMTGPTVERFFDPTRPSRTENRLGDHGPRSDRAADRRGRRSRGHRAVVFSTERSGRPRGGLAHGEAGQGPIPGVGPDSARHGPRPGDTVLRPEEPPGPRAQRVAGQPARVPAGVGVVADVGDPAGSEVSRADLEDPILHRGGYPRVGPVTDDGTGASESEAITFWPLRP
jgi:hypothetical protein